MFFKQKGFYISLACGIAAIGAFAALCINMNRSEQKEPVASASNPPQATAVATPETKEASSNHANSEVKEKKTKISHSRRGKRKQKNVRKNLYKPMQNLRKSNYRLIRKRAFPGQ